MNRRRFLSLAGAMLAAPLAEAGAVASERRAVHAELDRVYACWSTEALRYQKAVDMTRAYVEATKDVLRSAEAAATAAQGGLGHARRPDRGRQSKTRAIRCSRAPRRRS